MTKRIEVGYICTKGGGHFLLTGNSDHGVCGSHIGGIIYVESDDPRIDLQEQADSLERWVENAERALEAEYWANHRDEQ